MNNLQEIRRMKQRLDATFKRIDSIDPDSLELRSDFAKYLCVLVSGYLERAITQIVQEYACKHGTTELCKFVEAKTRRLNAKPEEIKRLLGYFSKEWRQEIEKFLAEDRKAAIDSVVNNRHKIAHGFDSGITYHTVQDYYEKSQILINRVQELCLPTSHS